MLVSATRPAAAGHQGTRDSEAQNHPNLTISRQQAAHPPTPGQLPDRKPEAGSDGVHGRSQVPPRKHRPAPAPASTHRARRPRGVAPLAQALGNPRNRTEVSVANARPAAVIVPADPERAWHRRRFSAQPARLNESNAELASRRWPPAGCCLRGPARPWAPGSLLRTLRQLPARRWPDAERRLRVWSSMGSSEGHDDRLRRGAAQRAGGSGVHLPRLLHSIIRKSTQLHHYCDI